MREAEMNGTPATNGPCRLRDATNARKRGASRASRCPAFVVPGTDGLRGGAREIDTVSIVPGIDRMRLRWRFT